MLSAEPHWANREASGESSYGRSLYNFLRTYDPTTGRYLESDPAGIPALVAMHLGERRAGPDRIEGNDSIALPESETSLYHYAALNPIGRIDPLGLSSLHTDGDIVRWRVERIQRVELIDYAPDRSGTELYSIHLTEHEARSILRPIADDAE